MHGRAAMIYRRERLMIYKGVPPLMICQTSLRFGLDKKISPTNIDEIFFGGTNRARTYDPMLVRHMLYQLSYDSEILLYFSIYGYRSQSNLAYSKHRIKSKLFNILMKKARKQLKSFLNGDTILMFASSAQTHGLRHMRAARSQTIGDV